MSKLQLTLCICTLLGLIFLVLVSYMPYPGCCFLWYRGSHSFKSVSFLYQWSISGMCNNGWIISIWSSTNQFSFVGGQSSLADYCTYYVAYSDGSCNHPQTWTVREHLTECWVRWEDIAQGEICLWNFFQILTFEFCIGITSVHSCRCMASSLVQTGFVRGSMTQGNGCYQHRCINNSLEV